MRYLVQYCVRDERRTAEVEAGSPREALVKFRHVRDDPAKDRGRPSQIMSVSADAEEDAEQ